MCGKIADSIPFPTTPLRGVLSTSVAIRISTRYHLCNVTSVMVTDSLTLARTWASIQYLRSSLVGQTGPVLAIEADPILFQRLLMNIDVSKSSNVNASCCLASSHFGEDIFIRQADNTVGHIHMKGEVVSDGNKIVLPSRPVDHLVQAVAYAMGKIDVEGVEPLVLKGAERCLQDGNPPVWLIEMNGLLRNYGFDETELIRWMRARDFLISTYDAATNTIS
jgi:FkbM family methyltransferase